MTGVTAESFHFIVTDLTTVSKSGFTASAGQILSVNELEKCGRKQ